jgi:hypothetical protein
VIRVTVDRASAAGHNGFAERVAWLLRTKHPGIELCVYIGNRRGVDNTEQWPGKDLDDPEGLIRSALDDAIERAAENDYGSS